MSQPYLQHARRHARRGSDPLLGMQTEYAFASFNSGYDTGHNQTVVHPGPAHELDVQWYSMETSNQDVFATHVLPTGTPNNAPGDKFLQLLQAGMYMALATLEWDTGSYDRYCYITPTFGIGVADFVHADQHLTPNEQAGTSASLGTGYPLVTQAYDMIIVPRDYVPGAIKVVAGNEDTVDHDIIGGTFGVYYFGGADLSDESDYIVY